MMTLVIEFATFNFLILILAPSPIGAAWPVIAKVISASLSAVAGYALHGSITFGLESDDLRSVKRGVLYIAAQLLGLALSVLVFWALTKSLNLESALELNLANAAAILMSLSIRFALVRTLVFDRPN